MASKDSIWRFALAGLLLFGCRDNAKEPETVDPGEIRPTIQASPGPRIGSREAHKAYPDQGWPTIHADPRNSDSTAATGARDIQHRWTALKGRLIGAGATVGADGTVYVGVGTRLGGKSNPNCFLFALDGKTGEEQWCSGEVNRLAVTSSPLIDRDGNLYHGDDRAMVSFTPKGELRWRTPIVGFPISAQFTPDGNLIFISHIGNIYVLAREIGAPVMPVTELIPGATPNRGDERACFVGNAKGNCYSSNTLAIDLDTGRFFFTLSRPNQSAAAVVAMRYISSPSPAIVPLWENDALGGGSASSPVISADGHRIYVNDRSDNVLALDATDGEVLWQYPLGFSSFGSLSVNAAGRIVPAGGVGGHAIAIIDRGDHAEKIWEHADLLQRSIAVQTGNDLVYLAGTVKGERNRLSLFTLDGTSGEILDKEQIPFALITVGTTMSGSGDVYVPALSAGLFGLLPAPDGS